MRLDMIEDPHLLEQRRRMGGDRWDEEWEGVLHMVPAPLTRHQYFGGQLVIVLERLASRQGLRAVYEVGFYRAAHADRQPDVAVYRRGSERERGLEAAAELLVEIV